MKIGRYCNKCEAVAKSRKEKYIPISEEEAAGSPLCTVIDPLRNAPHGIAYTAVIVDDEGNYASINSFRKDQQEVIFLLVREIQALKEKVAECHTKKTETLSQE